MGRCEAGEDKERKMEPTPLALTFMRSSRVEHVGGGVFPNTHSHHQRLWTARTVWSKIPPPGLEPGTLG